MTTQRFNRSANEMADGALKNDMHGSAEAKLLPQSTKSWAKEAFLQSTPIPEPAASTRIIRMLLLATYFWSCCFVIAITQYIGLPLYVLHRDSYYRYMAFTKKAMALFVLSTTQWWTTTRIHVSGDESVRDQIRQLPDGRVEYQFAERVLLISNHQLYNDWVYLWHTAYANIPRLHGHVYIVLKESISYIPIIGLGLRLAGFIFMARKMQTDRARLSRRLSQLSRRDRKDGKLSPMYLIMFPEGTNLSKNGRAASMRWAGKSGREDLKYQLIPRSAGTYFCLKALEGTVEWVYDCTLAYDGVPEGQYGQDIFTLRSTYFEGHPPPVHLHWRRFKVSDMPLSTLEAFDTWLRERWNEKDLLLEQHAKTGSFPCSDEMQPIVTEVRLGHWMELWGIYGVLATLAAVVAGVLVGGGWMKVW